MYIHFLVFIFTQLCVSSAEFCVWIYLKLMILGQLQMGRWPTNIYTFPYFGQNFLVGFIIILGNQLKQKVWSFDLRPLTQFEETLSIKLFFIIIIVFWFLIIFILSKGRSEELRDREKSRELYLQVQAEVEKCLAFLKEKRENDPYRNALNRLAYRATHGLTSEVPTFEL